MPSEGGFFFLNLYVWLHSAFWFVFTLALMKFKLCVTEDEDVATTATMTVSL